MINAIINGKIITPDKILENKAIVIKDEIIESIIDIEDIHKDTFEIIVDANGGYITPGFIDTHSDKIEQVIQPRPTSIMDFELSLKELERHLINQGITTMYHSISLFDDDVFGVSPLRTEENVLRIADLISSIHLRYHLIHHRFHLRIEIDNPKAFDIAKNMLLEKKVHQISFMDHTPGQGQYKNLEIYKKTITAYSGTKLMNMGFEGVMEHHQNKKVLSFDQLKVLSDLANKNNIPVASHDDDCYDKLEVNHELGVTVSEFPITIEVAKRAKEMGFYTVAGAPNILLGGSHSGNMSASAAIRENCVDILCSDYYPSAMLHSIFIMHNKYNISLTDMVNKLTLNPARAMKIDEDYGSIEMGKKADLLVINIYDGYPVITNAFIHGQMTSHLEYRV